MHCIWQSKSQVQVRLSLSTHLAMPCRGCFYYQVCFSALHHIPFPLSIRSLAHLGMYIPLAMPCMHKIGMGRCERLFHLSGLHKCHTPHDLKHASARERSLGCLYLWLCLVCMKLVQADLRGCSTSQVCTSAIHSIMHLRMSTAWDAHTSGYDRNGWRQ